ncbi:hypothetical protein ACSQ67_021363 [Phaseolus vulgaris]
MRRTLAREGPVELPFTSTPSIFATTDDPSPIQVASGILLTGAISVFLFRALRREAQRVKQSTLRVHLHLFGHCLGEYLAGVITLILYKFATTVDAVIYTLNLYAFRVRWITITVRTIVSGLTYLATFVFGLNSLGLLLYSASLPSNLLREKIQPKRKLKVKVLEQSNSSKLSIENSTDNTELSDVKEEQSSNDAQ